MFPVLHGPFGEDGTVQGLLKLANLPFVGSGVLSSSVCMDKDFSKRLFVEGGLSICKHLVFRSKEDINLDFKKVSSLLGTPMFVKPANMGSSVGIAKVRDEDGFEAAVESAFRFDNKIIIEENIEGREVEVCVLGNDNPEVSCVGEIIPINDFYSYEAKYLDEDGAKLEVPADLDIDIVKKVKKAAIVAFKSLECSGMARCDFFITKTGHIYINEINSIPGFTKISMYPRLWAHSGVSYSDLIDKLIKLAVSRYTGEQKLRVSY